MPWLVRGDDVLAAAEVAVTRRSRRRGLAGRDALEGVLVLRPCRQVHTFGTRFPIDVAFCDRDGFVLHAPDGSPPCLAACAACVLRDRGERRLLRQVGSRARGSRRGPRMSTTVVR
ncbi:MAG: DUF192 domain-containing protein [Acidimicrobiia bacterium]|nr:DUF192 domain-containing protein [Acidimicrobiia bacterium]